MNWLGAGLPSFVAALIGAIVGALAHVAARRHGIDVPPVVGVVAGISCALASRRRSGMRGVLVASLVVWAAALAEVLAEPSRGLWLDIVDFSARLDLTRTVAFAASALAAWVLASHARPGASSPRATAPPL